MNNEILNKLFREIREEKPETPITEVNKWIALSAASVGLFGLLSHFKLSILLTKKILIMTTLTAAMGIGITTFLMSSPADVELNNSAFEGKTEWKQQNPPSQPKELKTLKVKPTPSAPVNKEGTKLNNEGIRSSRVEIGNLELKLPAILEKTSSNSMLSPSSPVKKVSASSQIREVGHFTKVMVGSSFSIFITQGDQESVRLEVDERYIDLVITEVKNNELNIKFKNGSHIKNADKVEVHIMMKTIEEFHFSGAIHAKSMNTLNADKLKIDCSGAAEIDFDLNCDELNVISSGAAEMNLKGKSNRFDLNGSGASDIDADDFVVENSKMTISGASEIKCHVTGDLQISTSGASDVEYKGNPKTVDINSSGASKVKKRN
ncbi:MAG: head GIN domain-containing protein [Crocinitomicaceae bacterium]